ncbi:MAG TPA: hypothetical protein ENO03_06535 [Candidatus Aminicenantes bacterium]|nr:hypothetical protein [Candidatus Aminicenantes bacterium]
MRNEMSWTAIGLALVMIAAAAGVAAAEAPESTKPVYLYKTSFVRAAPGKLLELIALYKDRMAVIEAGGDARPFWWRHTQGDQWDLMLLTPMGGYTEYYAEDRVAKRDQAAAAAGLSWADFGRRLDACSAWKEDVFVYGPPLEFVKKRFEGTGYYHIEIMVSLPGKQAELSKEREMENLYGAAGGRPYNMIFVRDQGAAWDIYTLGCYRDLQHWAAPSPLTREERDAAAKKAGFAGADAIGPYMRTLIDFHRDTMGVAIR